MFIILYLIFSLLSLYINASEFIKFNQDLLKNSKEQLLCKQPQFFIKEAAIEESKSDDKIIVYHGESYGMWVFQLLLKAFLYPEAPDDWLPLRLADEKYNQVCNTDLMKFVKGDKNDENSQYTQFGLSASPNLVSDHKYESAWSVVCHLPSVFWPSIGGINGCQDLLNSYIEDNFVPDSHKEIYLKQKRTLLRFIELKRRLLRIHQGVDLIKNIPEYFPKTFDLYKEEITIMFNYLDELNEEYYNEGRNNEGVLLQIIMEKDLANHLVYSSHPFGWVKSQKVDKFKIYRLHIDGPNWDGEEIEPYSDMYEKTKNKLDYEQVRIAMNSDFRSYPSNVRIKSIAGIRHHPIDYEILKSMIKEMTEIKK